MVIDKSVGSRIFDGFLIVILVLITISCILPLWYTLAISLSTKSAAAAGQVMLWPVGFNFQSYKQLLADAQFFQSFWTSIKRVTLGAAINFIIVPLMAWIGSLPARIVFSTVAVIRAIRRVRTRDRTEHGSITDASGA
jgi:putative aldouronate transport system permease protein